MRAALVKEFGPPSNLVVEEVADLTAGPGEVLIEVAAVSINFPDILVVEGTYQNLPPRPFSPGKEAAGRIVAVGEGVTRLRVGQRVLALVEYGGYAEQITVPEDLVMELPDSMSYEAAAAFGLVYSTAYFGLLRRARMQAGETVLVTGAAGGVGSASVQVAKAWGGRVIALVHSEAKAELARSQGADIVLTSTPDTLRDDLLAATDGRGVDVAMDVLGGDYLTQIIRATAWEGRIIIVGFASGGQNPIKPGHLLVKNISVSGLQSSDYRDRDPVLMRSSMAEMFTLFEQGKLDAVVDTTFPLEKAADALQYVKDRQVKGKVVVTTGRG
ncbi:NADPH:quinone oxidoreductase family protein [Mycolicibacterium smegmatis]|uniref:Oxidoreductase, zinc-binding dehydrogenase family protein n=1 Tax=Mycolicibacterium smegmatis (strain MKD8) TaxID=1214915 RepID=A0A2U9PIN3_MYCSE|nr:NADPH:quinone oxidoreductase family protein [Mycolicibacterium smegmatis]AWT51596.1 oxidoreductase, zinc-binding dehydrogenase family protein [Mycolicibacterium smegmatis MKD8]